MASMAPEHGSFLQQEAFDQGTKVAQIFSGIFFTGLATWLTLTNGTKLAFVQRAALEKRLTVCCFINTYVGFFSAFFNFFQLTAVDDLLIPAQSQFTLDLSRPVEWLLTCPLMQLTLVLMGGGKIPEYRRILMPSFAIFILLCGTASIFIPALGGKIACYASGVLAFLVMMSFNRQQIMEYSAGSEGLLTGDSEFRKATMLLIATWAPFPLWFAASPEGFGIITNVLLIQVGWAFLNIVAKFSFIFYIQRIKDLYCNRLKTKRELVGIKPLHGMGGGGRHGAVSPPEVEFSGSLVPDFGTAQAYELADAERKKEKLSAVVVETMSFLGMAQHTDRFLKLLERAQVSSVLEVEALDKEQCTELSLPYDLVSALQRRLRVWKLEMVDDAELSLERGEEHYIKKVLDTPKLEVLLPNTLGLEDMGSQATTEEAKSRAMADCVEEMLHKTEEKILDVQQARGQSWERALEAIQQKLDHDLVAVERRLAQQIEALTKTAEVRGELRAFEHRMNLKFDEVSKGKEQKQELQLMERGLAQLVEQQSALVSAKLENCLQRMEGCDQKMDFCHQKVEGCLEKVVTCSATQSGQRAEALAALLGLLGRAAEQGRAGFEGASAERQAALEALRGGSEAMQAAQAKLIADAEGEWRRRFEELERAMACRDEEREASCKSRHEELVRQSVAPARRLEELLAQVQRLGDRGDAAVESLGSALQGELRGAAGRLAAKAEALHAAAARQQADVETGLQQTLENALAQAAATSQHGSAQAAQRAERACEQLEESLQRRLEQAVAQAVAQGAQQAAQHAAQRAERAVEGLEGSLQKRLDEAVVRATGDAAQQGAAHAAQRAEKAVEALESAQRAELSAAVNTLTERVEDIQAAQLRKVTEREERNARRMEELLELACSRSLQKVDDVGLDLKKELHGFARRLNSKIPFM